MSCNFLGNCRELPGKIPGHFFGLRGGGFPRHSRVHSRGNHPNGRHFRDVWRRPNLRRPQDLAKILPGLCFFFDCDQKWDSLNTLHDSDSPRADPGNRPSMPPIFPKTPPILCTTSRSIRPIMYPGRGQDPPRTSRDSPKESLRLVCRCCLRISNTFARIPRSSLRQVQECHQEARRSLREFP